MKQGWTILPFEEVISDESGGSKKTPSSEFLNVGAYPVIDQGKGLIAGYINDPQSLCNVQLPVIIFGDHTRCLKYIDFPFCMGADGIKVLRPKIEINEKYLFYYLKSLNIQNGGYERHFKYLKRSEIILPPKNEQLRIVVILDKVEALKNKRKDVIEKINTLTQSLFAEMFGDSASNLYKWPENEMSELAVKITDGEHLNPEFADSGIPIVMAGNVLDKQVNLKDAKRVNIALGEKFRLKCNPEKDDLLVVSRGATIGRLCIVDVDEPFALMGSVILIKPNKEIVDSTYLEGLLKQPHMYRALYKTSGSSAQQAIYLKDVKKLKCMLPPLPLQLEYKRKVNSIKTHFKLCNDSDELLSSLFFSIQQRAFLGEL